MKRSTAAAAMCLVSLLAAADASMATGVSFALEMPPGIHYCSTVWDGDRKGDSSFVTATDGRRHRYWFDLRDSRVGGWGADAHEKTWTGTIRNVAVRQLRFNRDLPAEEIGFVYGKPDFPADPVVMSVRPSDAVPRAGRPFLVEAVVRNFGTRPARNLRFGFRGLGAYAKVLDEKALSPAEPLPGFEGVDSVKHDMAPEIPSERIYRFAISGIEAGRGRLVLTLKADGVPESEYGFDFEVLPSLGLPKAAYPPEPVKIDTAPYEIGAFLFPGWTDHHWHAVWGLAPWRKPVLGWYDETKAETLDWQIKHLAENGVSFVYVDWYWESGSQCLNHWMEVFKSARYRKNLRWAVMWANHNRPGTHSPEDQEKATRWWCERFFSDPQYRTVDGVPEVVVWSPECMERDMEGRGGCRALLDLSRRVAREAGFRGIRFVAIRGRDDESREYLKRYEDMGFDATCCYRYLGLLPDVRVEAGGARTFDSLVGTSRRHWERIAAGSELPFLPSITTAWDDRPWNGELGWSVTGVRADGFRRLCETAKEYADATGRRTLLLGPMDEWGEGSIGYPNAEHGFGLLEAVRTTFGRRPASGWPLNYAPEDVGLVCPQREGPGAGQVRRPAPADSDSARHGSTEMNLEPVDTSGGARGGLRVAFLGNSITHHLPADHLGWTNSFGMAASSADRDYVHLVCRALERRERKPVEYVTKGMYPFESGWKKWDASRLSDVRAWRPDILVVAIGENMDDLKDGAESAAFEDALAGIVEGFLDANAACRVVVRGVFWENPAKDAALRRVALRTGASFVAISDLGSRPEMTAAGRFEHSGVAAHPGDAGMREIAKRIFEGIENAKGECK